MYMGVFHQALATVNVFFIVSFSFFAELSLAAENQNASQYSVDQFVRLLTSLVNESSSQWLFPLGRQKELNDNYQNAINNYFSQLSSNQIGSRPTKKPVQNQSQSTVKPQGSFQNDFPTTKPQQGSKPQSVVQYPYPVRPYLSPAEYGPEPYPPYQTPYPISPSGPGPYPPYPLNGQRPFPPFYSGYRPPFNYGPQSSFVAALDSISRYDDLRCVPRLLCEVTSGGRKINDNSFPLSFISKDAAITLLTVLNFVDDSPWLMFARAAFLGYSSGGDARACLVAYPTCPREPDMLIDYLNNHNGGFFRFFNQQLSQQPQYEQAVAANKQKNDKKLPQITSVINPKNYNIHSRILNDPIDAIQYEHKEAYNSLNSLRPQRKIKFQSELITDYQITKNNNTQHNLYNKNTSGSRRGWKFVFPSGAKTSMTFPDKTGTGNLILSSDKDGHYKIFFVSDEPYIRRKVKKIKFVSDEDQVSENSNRFSSKMKFPQDDKE